LCGIFVYGDIAFERKSKIIFKVLGSNAIKPKGITRIAKIC